MKDESLTKTERILLAVEVAVVYIPTTLYLAVLTLSSPVLLWYATGFEMVIYALILLVSWAGIVAVSYLFIKLRSGTELKKPVLVLSVIGFAALSPLFLSVTAFGDGNVETALFAMMPLLVAAHLIYLLRGSLFSGIASTPTPH